MLNFLDDLDSKINGVQSHIDKSVTGDSPWTPYHRLYDRYFYTGGNNSEPSAAKPATAKPAPIAKKTQHDAPLGVSLGDRLKGESLDLFSAPDGQEATDGD